MVTPGEIAQPPSREVDATVVKELQGWHLAREAAKRHNRNLLQYGAGLTAVLGINVGTGGMLVVAESLARAQEVASQLPWWASGMVTVTTLAGLLLLGLLIRTYVWRQAAERQADTHLEKLIALAPHWFPPRGD